MKRWRSWGCLIAMIPPIIVCVIIATYFGFHIIYGLTPTLFTSPLDSETQQHLCQLNADPDLESCVRRSGYAFEFYGLVHSRYPPRTLYDRVYEEIGSYLVGCDDWVTTPSDGDFRSCVYDFGDDGAFPAFFEIQRSYGANDNGRVWRICTFAIRDGSPLTVFECTPDWPQEIWLYTGVGGSPVTGRGYAVLACLCAVVVTVGAVVLKRRGSRAASQR